MRGIRLAGVIVLLAAAWLLAFDGPDELLKHYRGSEPIPAGLFQAYSRLVAALQTGDAGEIERNGLPHGLTISQEERPASRRDCGNDINLPYVKSGFQKEIISVRQDGEGCYLIRTASTALWFVETRHMGWRLYRWLDKPIQ